MRFENLTPHQYESIRPYIDTVVFSSYSPQALDIAVPHAGSLYINTQITNDIVERFQGRVSHLPLGVALQFCPITEQGLDSLLGLYPYQVRYGVLITDRVLTRESCQIKSARATWLVFDWWQWLYQRVPANRLPDAWMFLVHATSLYWNTSERTNLGVDHATAGHMASEGRQLLNRLSEWMTESVMSLWAEQNDT